MAVTGDFDKLARWEANLKEVEKGAWKPAAVKACGELTLKLIRDGFEAERDPFGNPWKPKVQPNGTKILRGPNRWVKTGYTPGRLRLFRVIKATKDGFAVESMGSQFRPHQYGFKHNKSGKRITARKMVPGKVIPIIWSSGYSGIFNKHIMKILKR